jgi:hypothetical protein
MMKLGIGALIAAVVVFFWGFAFWASGMINPFTPLTPESETAIAEALKANATTHGVYVIPDLRNGDSAAVAARAAAGPFAILMVKPDGAPMGDVPTMVMGFVNMLIMSLLVGLAMWITLPALPGYLDRLKLGVLIGAIAALFIDLASPIWWHHPWQAAAVYALYDVVAITLASAVLAYFVTPDKA